MAIIIIYKNKKNVLNFSGPGLGLDSIYLNLKNSNKEYHFEKVIILLPDFDRRITRFKHNDFWFKWPTLPELSTVWPSLLDPPTHEDLKIDNNDFIKEGEKTIKKILLDENSNYSKKILTRIMTFSSKNFQKTYISSWSPTVYS